MRHERDGIAATRPRRPLSGPTLAVLAVALPVIFMLGSCGRREEPGARPETGARGDWGEEWEEPGGRWNTGLWRGVAGVDTTDLTERQIAEFRRLLSIGYLSGSEPVPEESGVTIYDRERAYDGLNFYTSGHFAGAILMDMDGNVLHRWRHRFIDAWEAHPAGQLPRSSKGAGFWRRAHLFENGDVIAIFDWLGIIKIDKDSKLIWASFGGFHHDLEVLDDGRIYVLGREAHILPRIHPELPVLEDYIVVLDADGREISRLSILEAFENSGCANVLDDMKESGDIFHTNTLEVLDGRLADELPAFRAGNVLISVRELDVIAVVDMDLGVVVWAFRGPWREQHQPTVLPNGNMLVFDNVGTGDGSRVIELDVVSQKLVWLYEGDESTRFFSKTCGSNQRLPNGNTLISETDRGRAFEVTPDKTIVWEYVNPAQAGENREYIASLFEMIRLPPDFPLDWLN